MSLKFVCSPVLRNCKLILGLKRKKGRLNIWAFTFYAECHSVLTSRLIISLLLTFLTWFFLVVRLLRWRTIRFCRHLIYQLKRKGETHCSYAQVDLALNRGLGITVSVILFCSHWRQYNLAFPFSRTRVLHQQDISHNTCYRQPQAAVR